MNKFVKIGGLFIIALIFGSCARSYESISRDFQVSNRNYHVEVYSGGTLIKTYDFRGILNNQEGSDGYYFYEGDTLVEISGDIIVRSSK